MRYLLLIPIISAFLSAGCGNTEEPKLEAFSAEAFAFNVGDYYEVNASARVKGFLQEENNSSFMASVGYDIHVVTPEGDTLKSLISHSEDKTFGEKQIDMPIEAQFELDTTYAEGKYTVVFDVRDIRTENRAVTSAEFSLE